MREVLAYQDNGQLLKDLERCAFIANLNGQDEIIMPAYHLEPMMQDLAVQLRHIQNTVQELERYYTCRNYLIELDETYQGLPELFAAAEDFIGQVGDSAAPGLPVDKEAIADIDEVLPAFLAYGEAVETGVLIFDDGDPMIDGELITVTIDRAQERFCVSHDEAIERDFYEFARQAQRTTGIDVSVPVDFLVRVLIPLNDSLPSLPEIGEIEKRLFDIEDATMRTECEIDFEVCFLRGIAVQLQPLQNQLGLVSLCGINHQELEEWFSKVSELKTPQEKRCNNTAENTG